MKKLLFGTPGIPASTKPYNTENGVRRARALGLDAMELEFVHNVNVSEEKAPGVRKAAEESNITLTCHGQYYVNLAAKERPKWHASIGRMVAAAKRMHDLGGWSVTWHYAFYLKREAEEVYRMVRQGMKEVISKLDDAGVENLWLRPETTGKPTQWGNLQETIKLSQEFEQVLPCIDFSHLHARNNGGYNSLEEFRAVLSELEDGLGREVLDNMHIQVSGIEYGEKGERNHTNLKESDMRWRELLEAWKEFRIKGVVITESPNIEKDALLLQKAYKSL